MGYKNELDLGQNQLVGRISAGTGGYESLTVSEILAMLNVEAGADVTDAENVAAAGAVMESDTTTANMGFVIDDDTFATASSTTLATSESIKAYVDSVAASEMSYVGGYDASAAAPSGSASKGDVYTVTAAGDGGGYFSSALEIGDLIIAEIINPASESDWTVVQKNMDAASIKTSYESNADTNAFTDAEQSKLSGIEALADVTDAANVDAAGAVMESDYDANTILAATSDDTPTALTVAEQTLVGRVTGGDIDALTATEVRTLLNVEDGATADQTDAEIKTAYENNADTNAFTDAEKSKLSGIEALADVTDATNVAAAGAVMESDITTGGSGSVIDDDTFATASDTTLATSESIKAYVDAQVGAVDTLQEITDNGNTTSNMIDITGGEQLNDGAPLTALKLADSTMVTVGGGDGTGGVWITNDENPGLVNGGSQVYLINDAVILNGGGPSGSGKGDLQVNSTQISAIVDNHGIVISDGTVAPRGVSVSYSRNDLRSGIMVDSGGTKIHYGSSTDDIVATINSTGLTLGSGASVNEFSIDGTLAGNSDDAVPTEKAIKTYVDTQIGTTVLDAELIDTSAGAADAGKAIKLDADGHIDATMINDADINLDNITEGTTNVFFTAADNTKLDGIEALADVTDATNVAAAGAVMESDTTTANMSFVIDDDTFATASSTTLATSESIKAYVDSVATSEMSYVGGYDASAAAPSSTANKGDMYTVTVAGDGGGYFATSLEVGDVLISEIANPASESDWTVVQKDMDAASIKTSYESNADTNAFTDAEKSKLSGIEALADVTDATNVAAAGAVMESDTTTASMSFVIDDDTMATATDTTLATSESIKAYVDTQIATVDTLQEITDGGNTTTNMIEITGGEDEGGGINTSLRLANNTMLGVGAGDGTGGVWISNDINPNNPNGGSRISINDGNTWITAGDMTSSEWSDTQVSTGSVITTSKSADGGSSIIANPTGILLSVDTDGPDQAAILLEDKHIKLSISETNEAQYVLDATETRLILGSNGTTLTIDGTGSTFNNTLSLANGTSINEFSIDGTLAGDSDDAVPTEKAVKTYVDAQFASALSLQTVSTATDTYDGSSDIIHVTYTATGAAQVTIPTAWITSGVYKVSIKDAGGNAGSNNITIATEGSETIDGASTYVMNSDSESIVIYSDGTNLFVM